ncbi:MAG: hypothetical protein J6T74_01065 [Clostridia bacterium]|nr:hypothetical protein [Clostridia bacterium]
MKKIMFVAIFILMATMSFITFKAIKTANAITVSTVSNSTSGNVKVIGKNAS